MPTPIRRPHGPGGRRRGVTLVEMLVVVALVVLMMVILVQIFQVATGAISASRTIQELDVALRQADSIIRSDLAGVTAKMTPPNDPKDNRGYFEYGENALADAQGEDTDDYLAFTTRAPEGKSFSGRQWLLNSGSPVINQNVQPTRIESQVAEVIYFLRNGNLYRRVFLVVPERASTVQTPPTAGGAAASTYGNYTSPIFGGYTTVSWLGMNDISCRPGGRNTVGSALPPLPNDLGSLTNRENRAFRPRFANDFTGTASGGDGIPDDRNGDGIPDYYPTLYTDGVGNGYAPNSQVVDSIAFTSATGRVDPTSYNYYAFPFIYPGMYSVPDPGRVGGKSSVGLGWTHYMYPGQDASSNYRSNHSPLVVGDNIPLPQTGKGIAQTWWGFPTWRETMTGYTSDTQRGWTDPVDFVNRISGGTQPNGLIPFNPTTAPDPNSANFLPTVIGAETGENAPFSVSTDNKVAGSTSFVAIPAAPKRVWEDDLLLTGVRSFDVKAYDLNAPLYNTPQNGYFSAGYQDLGYGSTYYEQSRSTTNPTGAFNYVGGMNGLGATASTQTQVPWQQAGLYGPNAEPVGFGHEGRIPPLTTDFRQHPRRGYNIGDNGNGIIRLTRVWDSWSTDYTNAPDSDLFLNNFVTTTPSSTIASYPSFPAPYPSPLRGIQIQVRLADARGEKAKSITIRVDFTDKL